MLDPGDAFEPGAAPVPSKQGSWPAPRFARYGFPATAASSVICKAPAATAFTVVPTRAIVGADPLAQARSSSCPLRNVSPALAATVTCVASKPRSCQACPEHGAVGSQPWITLAGVPAQ